MLAGVSVEYYTRLERGNLGGVSDSVLGSLAQALRLDDAERTHLYDLARTANTARFVFLSPPRGGSTSIGNATPKVRWVRCGSRQAETPTTASCRI
jgi:hypothetical protein